MPFTGRFLCAACQRATAAANEYSFGIDLNPRREMMLDLYACQASAWARRRFSPTACSHRLGAPCLSKISTLRFRVRSGNRDDERTFTTPLDCQVTREEVIGLPIPRFNA